MKAFTKATSLIVFITVVMLSCKKEDLASTQTINQSVDTAATLVYQGTFTNGPYGSVMGKAEVYKQSSKYQVRLSNFNTSNGPALHVYLAKEAMPVNYLDLGAIQSTNGNQIYNVNGTPDFTAFKFVSIHCVAYNHLFGYAEIK